MYTFTSRVRYSEVDAHAHMSIGSVIDYMQDCTNFHAEDLGMGILWHKEHALMWVLNSWQIVINRYPEMGECITVGTQAYGFEKILGYRNFLITDEAGGEIAIANSTWVLMDLKRNRPVIIPEEMVHAYGLAEPLQMEYAPRKIEVPDSGKTGEPLTVREYHLDTNQHVNNRQYVQMAMVFADVKEHVRQLRAEYKRQAKLGDVLIPFVCKTGEKSRIVSLNGTDGKPYAIVEFLL